MISNKKIIVVLPAYNAEKTLERTCAEISRDVVDEVILVDDRSSDKTVELARTLGLTVVVHPKNLGYGGNQKTCYKEALARGADIVVMLHPDYQYPPKLVGPMASLIATGMFDVVLGSRILGGYALKGGMPFYKYVANRLLTALENVCTGQKLSEYHTGFRAYSREVLERVDLARNSDDFVFDNEILTQVFYFGYRIGEISAPCSYNQDCSSISFQRSVIYGLAVLRTTLRYVLAKAGLRFDPMFTSLKG
ncbi:MAG TPA: glycosyltransferase family 2 protein [Candidatus Omnitrophota bacterium]|nr:glycosyltransferase family 2 protein [Candidatus Omnitrophota bacterium]HQL42249.1 glycosyltransferase family 2 protein [Candidatus Omnitrophota bacterium]